MPRKTQGREAAAASRRTPPPRPARRTLTVLAILAGLLWICGSLLSAVANATFFLLAGTPALLGLLPALRPDVIRRPLTLALGGVGLALVLQVLLLRFHWPNVVLGLAALGAP